MAAGRMGGYTVTSGPSLQRTDMKQLPDGAKASVDVRKLADYCLNPSHPRGRHKARVFQQALGIQRSDAFWLRDLLLQAARSGEASHAGSDGWGDRWRIDVSVTRHGRSAVIRSIWLIRTGEGRPELITCWVL
jgi:hypothetical protein